MEAQNAAHGCDCGKVKVTLLNKRNAAEALTAPLNSEFFQAISGRKSAEMWAVMGELMDTLQAINPRLYNSVFAKNKFLTAPEMCATMVMQCRAAFAHTPNM